MSYALYGVSYNTKKSTSSCLRYIRIFISLFHSTRSRVIKYLSVWFLGRISREVLFELNLTDENEISDQWSGSVKQEKKEMSRGIQCAVKKQKRGESDSVPQGLGHHVKSLDITQKLPESLWEIKIKFSQITFISNQSK